tara:strand:+ start:1064 stop:1318 length:255 start_codon:yes stop_codon:yes gene_type:complete
MENYTITQTDDDLDVSDTHFKRFTVHIVIPEVNYDDTLTTRMIFDDEYGWIEMNCEVGVLLGMFGDFDTGSLVNDIVGELQSLC